MQYMHDVMCTHVMPTFLPNEFSCKRFFYEWNYFENRALHIFLMNTCHWKKLFLMRKFMQRFSQYSSLMCLNVVWFYRVYTVHFISSRYQIHFFNISCHISEAIITVTSTQRSNRLGRIKLIGWTSLIEFL